MMGRRIDLTGKRIGILTVKESLGSCGDKRRGVMWRCECDCGNVIAEYSTILASGKKLSCGCERRSAVAREAYVADIDRPISQYRRNLDSQIKEARKLFKPIDKSQFNDDWMREPLY